MNCNNNNLLAECPEAKISGREIEKEIVKEKQNKNKYYNYNECLNSTTTKK